MELILLWRVGWLIAQYNSNSKLRPGAGGSNSSCCTCLTGFEDALYKPQ